MWPVKRKRSVVQKVVTEAPVVEPGLEGGADIGGRVPGLGPKVLEVTVQG